MRLFSLGVSMTLLAFASFFSLGTAQAQMATDAPITQQADGSFSYTYEGVTVPLRMLDMATAKLLWGGYLLRDKDQLLTTEDMRWTPDWTTFQSQVPLEATGEEIFSYKSWYMWDRYVVVKVTCVFATFCGMETTDLRPETMQTPSAPKPDKRSPLERMQWEKYLRWPQGQLQDCKGGESFITTYRDEGLIMDACGTISAFGNSWKTDALQGENWEIPFPELPVLESEHRIAVVDLFSFLGDQLEGPSPRFLEKTPGVPVRRVGDLGLQIGENTYMCLQTSNIWTSAVTRVSEVFENVEVIAGSIFTTSGELVCPGRALSLVHQVVAGANQFVGTFSELPDEKTYSPLHTSGRIGVDKNGLWVNGRYGYQSNWAVEKNVLPENVYPLSSHWVGDVSLNQFVWPGVIAGPFPAAGLTSTVDTSQLGARLVTRDGRYTYLRDQQAYWLPTNFDADLISWLAEAVDQGVLRGREDGTPSAMEPLLRAEGMTLIARALNLEEKYPRCDVRVVTTAFRDVDAQAWYARTVCLMLQAGIVRGNPDGTLTPGSPLRVAEFLTMVARAVQVSLPEHATGDFWYMPVMEWALAGKEGDWFRQPGDLTPRWWAAAMTMYLQQ